MGRRFRFFSVFTVLFAFFYINTGFATTILPVTYDYSCPSYKKYYECSSGYYLSDCGTSGWTGQSISSPAFGNSCEECPSGYTCSGGVVCPKARRALNVNGKKIYLNDQKLTTPSLNVKIGTTTFYGSMSTSIDGPLKIKYNGTTYSVYDDTML